MSPAVVTALHRRRRLTAALLAYYAEMGLPVAAAYTGPEDVPDHLPAGVHLVEHANDPRSDKWNAACRLLEGVHAGGAFVTGSDDFMSRAFVEEAEDEARRHEPRTVFLMPTRLVLWRAEEDRFIDLVLDNAGCGRYLSRSLLEEVAYQPWLPGSSRNSDYSLARRAGLAADVVVRLDNENPILSVHTDADNMTPLTHWRRCARAWRPHDDAGVFADLVETLRRLPEGADENRLSRTP